MPHTQYTRPFWPRKRSLEQSYLSDELIDRMHSFFLKIFTEVPAFSSEPWALPAAIQAKISIEDSLEFAKYVLEKISPELTAKAYQKGHIEITPATIHSRGYCYGDTIFWESDGTINDTIYIPHEAGHLIGNISGPEDPCWNISEWQSHFMQFAAYEALIEDHALGDNFSATAHLHRESELMLNLFDFHQALDAINILHSGKFEESERHYLNKTAQKMHYHATAIFIALALWEQYKNHPDNRETLLNGLYKKGKEATPESILRDFDLLDVGKLEQSIKSGLEKIGFSNLHPSIFTHARQPSP